jgi:hypothetical protein
MLSSFPIDVVNDIMWRSLDNSPSVGTLLLYYKNTFLINGPSLLPLSKNTDYINNAAKSLLVRLNQTPANEELASYQQLMTTVFTHHLTKLTLDQKIDLIRRSNITPWEQKSTSQKLELLGRIQAPTFWGKAKVRLQLLSWRVQYAAAWTVENHVIKVAMLATVLALCCGTLLSGLAKNYSYISRATDEALNNIVWEATKFLFIAFLATTGASLAMTSLGLALQIPIFPKSIKEKGAWIQSVSWNCFLIALDSFLPFSSMHDQESSDDISVLQGWIVNAYQKLPKLLLPSCIEKETFFNAHLPDLMNQWLHLTMPCGINTESSQTLQ